MTNSKRKRYLPVQISISSSCRTSMHQDEELEQFWHRETWLVGQTSCLLLLQITTQWDPLLCKGEGVPSFFQHHQDLCYLSIRTETHHCHRSWPLGQVRQYKNNFMCQTNCMSPRIGDYDPDHFYIPHAAGMYTTVFALSQICGWVAVICCETFSTSVRFHPSQVMMVWLEGREDAFHAELCDTFSWLYYNVGKDAA